jgi:multiple sugar transport system substrate-binding protein
MARLRPVVVGTAAVLALVTASCGGGANASARTVTINWYIGKQSTPAFVHDAAACSKESGGRYRISINDLPADASQQREQLVRRLAAKDNSIDVIGMDVIWTAEFAEAGWVKEWTGDRLAGVADGRLPTALTTAQYKGRTWAAPQNTNAQILFYRKDLVPQPPLTWDDMINQSKRLGPNARIEAQGARYEGLVVWFASLVASAGGQVIEGDHAAVGPPTVKALQVMHDLVASGTADPALSNAEEDTTTQSFIAGRAAFMVNYSALFSSIKAQAPDLVPKIGFAPWPRVVPDLPSRPTLGGFNLGVGAYTKHPAEAFDAVTCLVNEESQVRNAAEGGLPPTIATLYQNPTVRDALSGFADILLETIRRAAVRPVTPAYNDVSLVIQRTLHPESNINPDRTAKELKTALDKALRSGGLI